MNKKVLSIALVSMMSLGLFAGCGKDDKPNDNNTTTTTAAGGDATTAAPSGPVTLKVKTSYGGDDGNATNYKNVVKAYEEASGNTIKDSSETYLDDTKVKIMTDFEVGAEPDILFYYNGADSNTIVSGGKVVSIDTIREVFPDYASNMDDARMGASPVDKKNYSVPVNGYWESLFVNKTVTDAANVAVPGTDYTWDQFLTDCEAVKASGATPIAASIFETPNYWFEFCAYNFLDRDSLNVMPETVDDRFGQAWVNSLNDLKTLYEKGYFPANTLTALDAETYNLMVQDKAAFFIDGSWKVGSFEKDMADTLDHIVMAFPPAKNDRAATDIIGGLSMGYFITTKCWEDESKRAAAVDFINNMTSDETVSLFSQSGQVTALKNGASAPAETSSLIKSVYEMNAKVTGVQPAVEDNMDAKGVRVPFFQGIKDIVTGKSDSTQAVTDVLAAHYESLK